MQKISYSVPEGYISVFFCPRALASQGGTFVPQMSHYSNFCEEKKICFVLSCELWKQCLWDVTFFDYFWVLFFFVWCVSHHFIMWFFPSWSVMDLFINTNEQKLKYNKNTIFSGFFCVFSIMIILFILSSWSVMVWKLCIEIKKKGKRKEIDKRQNEITWKKKRTNNPQMKYAVVRVVCNKWLTLFIWLKTSKYKKKSERSLNIHFFLANP